MTPAQTAMREAQHQAEELADGARQLVVACGRAETTLALAVMRTIAQRMLAVAGALGAMEAHCEQVREP